MPECDICDKKVSTVRGLKIHKTKVHKTISQEDLLFDIEERISKLEEKIQDLTDEIGSISYLEHRLKDEMDFILDCSR